MNEAERMPMLAEETRVSTTPMASASGLLSWKFTSKNSTLVNTVLVDSNSMIDVSAVGSATSPSYYAGGSHGGRGGLYSNNSRPTYGDLYAPVTLGEAGYGTMRGGGKLHLVVGSLQLEGDLLAR